MPQREREGERETGTDRVIKGDRPEREIPIQLLPIAIWENSVTCHEPDSKEIQHEEQLHRVREEC